MSPDEMKALVRRHIEEGFNHGDWNVCEKTLADDYTARYGADGKANVGRDHYVMVCKMLRKSFPDVAITIEDLVVEGDKIVNRYIERGTLTGRAVPRHRARGPALREAGHHDLPGRGRSPRRVVGRRGHARLVPPARQVHRRLGTDDRGDAIGELLGIDGLGGRGELGRAPPSVLEHRALLEVGPPGTVHREAVGAHAEEVLGLVEVVVFEVELDPALEEPRADVVDFETRLLAQLAARRVLDRLAVVERRRRA